METAELEKTRISSGKIKILGIRVKRTRDGLNVRLYGGREIRDVFANANSDEYLRQAAEQVRGGPVLFAEYGSVYNSRAMATPAQSTFGAWILRAKDLGMTENGVLEFTLSGENNPPHSEDIIREQIRTIGEIAQIIFRTFCRPFAMKSEVFTSTEEHGRVPTAADSDPFAPLHRRGACLCGNPECTSVSCTCGDNSCRRYRRQS